MLTTVKLTKANIVNHRQTTKSFINCVAIDDIFSQTTLYRLHRSNHTNIPPNT